MVSKISASTFKAYKEATQNFDDVLTKEAVSQIKDASQYMRYLVCKRYPIGYFERPIVSYAMDIYTKTGRALQGNNKMIVERMKPDIDRIRENLCAYFQHGIQYYPEPALDFWPLATLHSKEKTRGYSKEEMAEIAGILVTPRKDEAPWLNMLTHGQYGMLRAWAPHAPKDSVLQNFVNG